jgi:hypothetical protein
VKRRGCSGWTALLLALLAAAPAAAQDVAFRGWGVRAGVSDDPDQFVAGVQANFGEIVPNLRLQPNFEVGVGDDHTIFSAGVPVHYRFPVESLTLYGGGGLVLAWVDRDLPRDAFGEDDDSEFVIGPLAVGGIEWPVGESELFTELSLSGGDLPNLKLVLGWMF